MPRHQAVSLGSVNGIGFNPRGRTGKSRIIPPPPHQPHQYQVALILPFQLLTQPPLFILTSLEFATSCVECTYNFPADSLLLPKSHFLKKPQSLLSIWGVCLHVCWYPSVVSVRVQSIGVSCGFMKPNH